MHVGPIAGIGTGNTSGTWIFQVNINSTIIPTAGKYTFAQLGECANFLCTYGSYLVTWNTQTRHLLVETHTFVLDGGYLSPDTWHDIAITYSGSSFIMSLYVDGALRQQAAGRIDRVSTGTLTWGYTTYANATYRFCGCMVNEAAIWNVELAPGWITALAALTDKAAYNAQVLSLTVFAYWQLDEVSTIYAAVDSSGHNFTGSYINNPVTVAGRLTGCTGGVTPSPTFSPVPNTATNTPVIGVPTNTPIGGGLTPTPTHTALSCGSTPGDLCPTPAWPCGVPGKPPCHVYILTPVPIIIAGGTPIWPTMVPKEATAIAWWDEHHTVQIPHNAYQGTQPLIPYDVNHWSWGVGFLGPGASETKTAVSINMIAQAPPPGADIVSGWIDTYDYGCAIQFNLPGALGGNNFTLCFRYKYIHGVQIGGYFLPLDIGFSFMMFCTVLYMVIRGGAPK
jgi:hypothetical protein